MPRYHWDHTDYHELPLDYILEMVRKNLDIQLKIVGNDLVLSNSLDEVISRVTISYADTALNDTSGRPIKAYLLSAATSGNTLVFTDGQNGQTVLTVPFSTTSSKDVNNKDITSYMSSLTVVGDKLRVTLGNGSTYDVVVPFSTSASTDTNGRDLTTYATSIDIEDETVTLRDSMGRVIDTATINYGKSLRANTADISLIGADGTVISTIVVPYATLSDHSNNSVENITISGNNLIFTTYDGHTFSIESPYSVKAQKDDAGNVIKSTYVARIVNNPSTGEITFYAKDGSIVAQLTPTVDSAVHDSYNNLIADYIKSISTSVLSDYVTITTGTGTTSAVKIEYATRALCDSLNHQIHNHYIHRLACIQDVDDGHWKLAAYNGEDSLMWMIEINAYMAQVDVNERALTSYVGEVSVNASDNVEVKDGEGNVINTISGKVTTTPAGTISGTAVSVPSTTVQEITSVGTLPSKAADTFVAPSKAADTFVAPSKAADTFVAPSKAADTYVSPAATYDSATETLTFTFGSFTEGAFTPGSFTEGAFTPGSFTEGAFNPGSFTEGAFNAGTLPTSASKTVGASGAATVTEGTFTGTQTTEDVVFDD